MWVLRWRHPFKILRCIHKVELETRVRMLNASMPMLICSKSVVMTCKRWVANGSPPMLSVVRQESWPFYDKNLVHRLKCDDGQLMPVRSMAGHSKWQNIRHVKASKDLQRANAFDKLSRQIRLAAREGIPDPKLNLKLAQAVELAKSKSMPVARIEAAIKGAAASKEKMEHLFMEVKTPGGCFLIIEGLSDNLKKSRDSVRTIINKTGGKVVEGASKHLFDHKGIINVKPNGAEALEKALEDAIEAGAEDVKETEDEDGELVLQFLSDPNDFYVVKKKLEAMNYGIKSSGLKHLPHTRQKVSDVDLIALEKMYSLIEDLPDVTEIFDNIE